MIQVTVISVGKIKEKYFLSAIEEYEKRLKRYASLNLIELKDESVPESLSDAQKLSVLKKEGDKILEKIPLGAYVVALCGEGKEISSEELSEFVKNSALSGKSHLVFIIGGSLGLSEDVKKRADFKLSFSKMTFPHRLMKVILLEQIYRAFTIIEGKTYHK